MTLSELRALVRRRLRDTVKPYLVSDDEIDANLNEAQREACARALLIESDDITIDINTDDVRYELDPRIIDVRGIKDDKGCDFFGWTLTETHLVLDRKPAAAMTLTLTAQLLPSADMETPGDAPDIRPIYHDQMAGWAIHLCYLIPDSDLFNPQAADRYADQFTRAFGERPSARTRRNQRDKGAKTVANNGYI